MGSRSLWVGLPAHAHIDTHGFQLHRSLPFCTSNGHGCPRQDPPEAVERHPLHWCLHGPQHCPQQPQFTRHQPFPQPNHQIRSAIPVVTCILAIFVERKIPTGQEATALTMLTIGVMVAVWQNSMAGKISGIILCIAATVCNGATMTFSSKLLSEELDILRLTFYIAPVSLVCLLPFYLIREHREFVPAFSQNHANILGILLLSSINAVCYNLIHALVIKHTSAVASTVLGQVKIVGLLLLSAVLLGESKEFSSHMLVGCVMALGGFFWYSHLRIAARSKTEATSLIVSTTSENNGGS